MQRGAFVFATEGSFTSPSSCLLFCSTPLNADRIWGQEQSNCMLLLVKFSKIMSQVMVSADNKWCPIATHKEPQLYRQLLPMWKISRGDSGPYSLISHLSQMSSWMHSFRDLMPRDSLTCSQEWQVISNFHLWSPAVVSNCSCFLITDVLVATAVWILFLNENKDYAQQVGAIEDHCRSAQFWIPIKKSPGLLCTDQNGISL